MTRHLVDGTGTRRRLRALMTQGWSKRKLALRLGMLPSNLWATFCSDRVYASTAVAVRRLYDELWDATPSRSTPAERVAYSKTVRYAQARGYAPPLAWDDDTIDDPEAVPQGMETSRRRHGLLPPVEELQWLLQGGETPLSIAARFGVQPAAVERALLCDREAA